MARTEAGLRNGGLSLRGEYRESRLLAGKMGFEATDISDGSDETKLFVVMPDVRRDCEIELAEGRDVYDVL